METMTYRTTRVPTPRADGCCGTILVPVLDEARLVPAVQRFKALADATRLTILATLAANEGAVCACDLGDDVALGQPTVAHHLKVLRDAALVLTDRHGKWAYYRLHPDAADWVRATLAALPR